MILTHETFISQGCLNSLVILRCREDGFAWILLFYNPPYVTSCKILDGYNEYYKYIVVRTEITQIYFLLHLNVKKTLKDIITVVWIMCVALNHNLLTFKSILL